MTTSFHYLECARDNLLLAALATNERHDMGDGVNFLAPKCSHLERAFGEVIQALRAANREKCKRMRSACFRIMNFIRSALADARKGH